MSVSLQAMSTISSMGSRWAGDPEKIHYIKVMTGYAWVRQDSVRHAPVSVRHTLLPQMLGTQYGSQYFIICLGDRRWILPHWGKWSVSTVTCNTSIFSTKYVNLVGFNELINNPHRCRHRRVAIIVGAVAFFVIVVFVIVSINDIIVIYLIIVVNSSSLSSFSSSTSSSNNFLNYFPRSKHKNEALNLTYTIIKENVF